MHIKRTKTYTAADGSPRYSFRLVESRREGDKVRKHILLNLGTAWNVPKEKWKAVTAQVKALLTPPGASLFDVDAEMAAEHRAGVDEEVEAAAEDIVRRLRQQGMKAERSEATVHVVRDSVGKTDSRSVGCERLCRKALSDLQFGDMLAELGLPERDVAIAEALVIARAVHPGSERATHALGSKLR